MRGNVVEGKGDDEKQQKIHALPDNRFYLVPFQQPPDEYQHEKTGRNGDVGLVDAQRRDHAYDRRKPPQSGGTLKKVHCGHCQQKGKREGIGGEHVSEGAGQRGKHQNAPCQQRLKQFAADSENPDDDADRNCHERNGKNAVNPRHGEIGENQIDSAQSPPPGFHRGALHEQGVSLVVVQKFIGKGKCVRQKPGNQRRGQGDGVFPDPGQEPCRCPLNQQRFVCLLHGEDLSSVTQSNHYIFFLAFRQ